MATKKVAKKPVKKAVKKVAKKAPAKKACCKKACCKKAAAKKAPAKKAVKKPAKKTTRKPRAKKTAEAVPTAEQIERLRKMAPGSVKKLANTITSQLKLAGPDAIIDELSRQGVLTLDHDHVIWN